MQSFELEASDRQTDVRITALLNAPFSMDREHNLAKLGAKL